MVLRGLIKMADAIITFKIMPESPDVNLDEIQQKATELIAKAGGEVGKSERVPVAFGLVALNLVFVIDEKLGGTDDLEKEIEEVAGINSVEVTDVRRAIG